MVELAIIAYLVTVIVYINGKYLVTSAELVDALCWPITKAYRFVRKLVKR